jgi:hypothetical protein
LFKKLKGFFGEGNVLIGIGVNPEKANSSNPYQELMKLEIKLLGQ